jgi:hypothetical protein
VGVQKGAREPLLEHGDGNAGASFISFAQIQKCKTPKIVNKLENLKKAKL